MLLLFNTTNYLRQCPV